MPGRNLLFCSVLLTSLAVLHAGDRPAHSAAPEFRQRRADRFTTRHGLPAGRVLAIRSEGTRIHVRTEAGGAAFADGRWSSQPQGVWPMPAVQTERLPSGARVLDAARGADRRTWVVTSAGVFRSEGDRYVPFAFPRRYLTNQPIANTDAEFTCVEVDRLGTVWLGGSTGLYATDGAAYWHPFDRTAGLPYEYVTCLALGAGGEIWAGTTEGVCRNVRGEWQYYWGPRWLPHNRVNAITVAPDGSAWVATDGGVAHLYDQTMTLARKAAHYQEVTDTRHRRRGFVCGINLKSPGDPTAGHRYEASDNDGLWTAVYVAAQSFRYAATHDPAARLAAKESMQALLDLVRYTGIRGFPARAIIRKAEDVGGYDPDETVRVPGEPDKIWFQSPVDPDILCKGDTSSDELDGHYFAWVVYHDLVADAEEKKLIRAAVEAVTDNLLNHDFTLVGHTGRKTRWGVYSPKYVNDDPLWWEERGLNSLSMLSYLRIAQHIVGHPRYEEAFRELAGKHHYLLNLVMQKIAEPWDGVNHSDDQMAFMMYYAFFHVEKDPEVRRFLFESLERSWKVERPEHSPFFNFVFGAATQRSCDAEAAIAELEAWPWEVIEWQVRAVHRHDVQLLTKHREGQGRVQLDRALPASERRIMRWNGNPYQADGGSPDGNSEDCGSAWLLPYWMGRYHGLVAADR